MWFDIIKIQQGTFSTLVPKNMPKIREDTPCRDRLNGIMDEIGNTIGKNEEVTMTSQDGSGFLDLIKVFNKDAGISTQLLEWILPEPIHVKFTSGSSAEPNLFDEIPEDVCCAFLEFLEESKKEVITNMRNVTEWTHPFRKEYKDWTFLGIHNNYDLIDIIHVNISFDCFKTEDGLNYNPEHNDIRIEFQLDYKESGIEWQDSRDITDTDNTFIKDLYSEEEFYRLWVSKEDSVINRRNEDTNEWIYADWLKKKEVDRWFFNLDPMWWL